MTLDMIAVNFDLMHLSNYKNCIAETNDTFTVKLESFRNETANEFEDRVTGLANRLRMKFTVVSISMNLQLLPLTGEVEFID